MAVYQMKPAYLTNSELHSTGVHSKVNPKQTIGAGKLIYGKDASHTE